MPYHHADLDERPDEAFVCRERAALKRRGSMAVICAPAGWTRKRVLAKHESCRVLGTPKPCRYCTGKFRHHKREHWIVSDRARYGAA